MFLKNSRVQKFLGGGILEQVGIRLISFVEYVILSAHKKQPVLRKIFKIRMQRRTLVTFNEAFLVHSLASSVANMPGDFAEVGVFQGSTAKMICEVKGERPLHLFDTFEGLPPSTTDTEKRVYSKKQYACSFEAVQQHLSGYPEVHFYKGFFPESATPLDPARQFAFVHLDVDLYQSTLDCLRYFYPRMLPGGILLSHDYSILESVEKAFTEFLADKPERLIDLPTTQCMFIKR